jgi:hypothetical protein
MHDVVIVPEGYTEYHWFAGLLRSCITAEGWDPTESDTLNAAALGVLPTQDANVAVTYAQFRAVAPNLLPLCDGDQSGKEYVKAIARQELPPKRIARLADGLDFESVLAWILEPLLGDEAAWTLLGETIAPSERSAPALRAALTSAKTRWDFHDAILSLIPSSKPTATRIRLFLGGLAAVAAGSPTPSGWRRQGNPGEVEVWIWDLPGGADPDA